MNTTDTDPRLINRYQAFCEADRLRMIRAMVRAIRVVREARDALDEVWEAALQLPTHQDATQAIDVGSGLTWQFEQALMLLEGIGNTDVAEGLAAADTDDTDDVDEPVYVNGDSRL